ILDSLGRAFYNAASRLAGDPCMRPLARFLPIAGRIARTATRTALVLLVGATALAGAGAGCAQCGQTAGTAATRAHLPMVPREPQLVARLNTKKMRPTPVWKRFTDMTEQSPEQKARYADLVKQPGLDPLKQIDSAFVALPTAGGTGDFA